MSEDLNNFVGTSIQEWREGIHLLERLFTVAQPGTIFSEPIQADGRTIITASEVSIGMGFGHGVGAGTDADRPQGEGEGGTPEGGMGGGGGGGGGAFGRPVATIIVDSQGVRVEPVVDVTKIALALFTALGSMVLMFSRMRQASRR
ncbi:MAG: hypothetical protein M3220_10630 [Chloroflexota bacterium]|nr:hypothetical protein [Chloroflexota bacterium]